MVCLKDFTFLPHIYNKKKNNAVRAKSFIMTYCYNEVLRNNNKFVTSAVPTRKATLLSGMPTIKLPGGLCDNPYLSRRMLKGSLRTLFANANGCVQKTN